MSVRPEGVGQVEIVRFQNLAIVDGTGMVQVKLKLGWAGCSYWSFQDLGNEGRDGPSSRCWRGDWASSQGRCGRGAGCWPH